MPSSLVTQSQPYVNATSAIASKTGDWIQIGEGLSVICFEFVFDVGAGNVTGAVRIDHTAQLNGTPASATILNLPLGSLHTGTSWSTLATLAGAPNPSPQVTLTAMITGRFEIMLGQVPPGQIRSVYNFTSGTGASPNTLTQYVTGR